MKFITGNILDLAENGAFDVIIHGCNCETNMGAGLAKSIAERYPAAEQVDNATANISPAEKLGEFSGVMINNVTIINAYIQEHARGYGSGETLVDYDAVRQVFRSIADNFSGQRIAYPKLGAGLAGGDWNTIAEIIDEELAGEDHTLVIFNG
ncbi:MAG: macro domain-containing protein [Enterococcus sp.]|nr:macro domain-containing protein [Enterococcus sp.]